MNSNENQQPVCIHSSIYSGMCTDCGAFVEPDDRYHKSRDLYILSSIIEDNGKLELFLRERKKLALVVDLDKTVIDTIRVSNEEEALKVIANDKEHESDFFYFSLSEMYLVRIRPHTHEFLKEIAPYYFMQVYTLSQRAYALEVLKKIDPDGIYFKERLLSREDGDPNKKSLSNFSLSGQHMVVVIDDSPDVWKNPDGSIYKGLVQLEPFQFFANPTQKDCKDINSRSIEDDSLDRMKDVLIQLHQQYYHDMLENVSESLDSVKAAVFSGCYIYFCGIWNEADNNMKDFYIKKAEEFGAYVMTEFTPYVTHVVTNDPLHPDVLEAQKYNGVFIMTFRWFWKSFLKFEKQPELAIINEVRNQFGSAMLKTSGSIERTEPPDFQDIETDDDLFNLIENNEEEDDAKEYDNAEDEDINFLFMEEDETKK